ncbi:hypothetical protein CHUAL_014199 [Chamberlinius hualienensis]
MSQTENFPPPPIQWAQRANLVYLNICLPDCKAPKISIEPQRFYFRSKGGVDQKEYEISVNLYSEVIPEDSKYVVRDRQIEVMLKKKEEGPFWKRLLKEEQKAHWLKVDFNKWRDEDDSEDEYENQDLEDMFKQMGGLGDGGKGLGDLEGEEDSDEEELPDLE